MKLLKTISATLLAFLVLLSSSSFIVGIHWCGGHIQDYALFTKAERCPMEKQLPPCHKPSKNTCCEDQTVVHESAGFKSSINKFSFQQAWQIQPSVVPVVLAVIVPQVPPSKISFSDYHPPTRSVDLTVDLQTFLI